MKLCTKFGMCLTAAWGTIYTVEEWRQKNLCRRLSLNRFIYDKIGAPYLLRKGGMLGQCMCCSWANALCWPPAHKQVVACMEHWLLPYELATKCLQPATARSRVSLTHSICRFQHLDNSCHKIKKSYFHGVEWNVEKQVQVNIVLPRLRQ